MPQILLYGPTCTGKTEQCLQEFVAFLTTRSALVVDDPRAVYLVPTLEHAERIRQQILDRLPVHGYPALHERVRTFDQFVEAVYKEVTPTPREIITLSAAGLLLQRGLQELTLTALEQIKTKPGIVEQLLNFVAELQIHGIDPFNFNKTVALQRNRFTDLIAARYEDVGRIYLKYDQLLREHQWIDRREIPLEVCAMIKRNPAQRPWAWVVLDGFYRFSPAQQEFLRRIFPLCQELRVTLTASDNLHVQESRVLFEKMGLKVQESEPRPSAPARISVLCGATPRKSMEEICRRIQEQKQLHPDLRWSDFALIYRELTSQRKELESVFRYYDIPVHIHEGKPLIENALVNFILSALGLSNESSELDTIPYLLMAGYSPISTELAQAYLTAPNTLAESEEQYLPVRNWLKVYQGLRMQFNLTDSAFSVGSDEPQTYQAGLIAFVQSLNIWNSDRDSLLVNEDIRALTKLIDIFGEVDMLGDKFSLCARERQDLLTAAIEVGEYQVLVEERDCVQIYDTQLIGQKRYHFVYACALEGDSFPRNVRDDFLLQQESREILADIFGAFNTTERLYADEQARFAQVLTQAGNQLYLCWSRYDGAGREQQPSPFIQVYRGQQPDEILPTGLPIIPGAVYNRAEWLSWMRELTQLQCTEVAYFLARHPLQNRRLLELSRSLIAYQTDDWSVINRWSKACWPEHFSPSGLECYWSCAWKYYAGNILRFQIPAEYFDFRQQGQLLHTALHNYFSGKPLSRELLTEQLSKVGCADLRPIELLWRKVQLLVTGVHRDFKPELMEWRYGGENPLIITAMPDEEIIVKGAIDRVDIHHDHAVIIDYKRSGKRFTRDSAERGETLQLPMYWLALERISDLQPIAAEYLWVDLGEKHPLKRSGLYMTSGGGLAANLLDGVPANAVKLTREEMTIFMNNIEDQVRKMAGDIRGGEFIPNPQDELECSNCDYWSACRI